MRQRNTAPWGERDVLRVDQLDYDLPGHLIATHPAQPRDASRLMVVRRRAGEVEHAAFADLPRFLARTDTMVFNRSRVVPARLSMLRRDTGGRAEGLFVHELDPLPAASGAIQTGRWLVMIRAGWRVRPGQTLELLDHAGRPSGALLTLDAPRDACWEATVTAPVADGDSADCGSRATSAADLLDRVGATPLPPYILKARDAEGDHTPDALDRAAYQTVYADPHRAGSVAAPTAGLHFTPGLLERLADAGVERAEVILHVGLGTFKPVKAAHVEEHPMHAEAYEVPASTARTLAAARARSQCEAGGSRIIAVGTTSVRTLESLACPLPSAALEAGARGETRLLIAPGFRFAWTDGLVTNFHLPRSTLMALVAALLEGGAPRLIELYRLAISRGYRFYSYGDAMLILP